MFFKRAYFCETIYGIYRERETFAGANFCENATTGSRRYFHGSYFCDKILHSAAPTRLLKNFCGFYICGSWLIRENRKSLHCAKGSRYKVLLILLHAGFNLMPALPLCPFCKFILKYIHM